MCFILSSTVRQVHNLLVCIQDSALRPIKVLTLLLLNAMPKGICHSVAVYFLFPEVCLILCIFSAELFEQSSRVKPLSRCHVQSEGQEGTVSGESILADQQALELELQIAIEEENYAQAAIIRDSLKNLHEDSRALVLAANARFYNSFRTGDLAGMQALWAQGDHVCCVHPGVPVISGYDLVIQSWEYVLADYEFPLKIELKDVLVHVRGDLGYVTCVEFIKTTGSSWGRQTATNVFERINGLWFICIHHATRIVT